MEFVPSEKGVPIRQPSTANLMLDSFDRGATYPSPWEFSINRSSSIFNGFFTRIGTTEVVLEWNDYNISSGLGNDTFTVDVSGSGQFSAVLDNDFYTVEKALNEIAARLKDVTLLDWSIVLIQGGTVVLDLSGGQFSVVETTLSKQLGVYNPTVVEGEKEIINPDLRPWRYLDFVSAQLTYNQDLKDASTCPIVRDVLCRWYFAWDNPPTFDLYGYPILMGYEPFVARRLFNPPKQIRWDPRQPVGNLAFEVYGQSPLIAPTGILLSNVALNDRSVRASNWLMTLQISEV